MIGSMFNVPASATLRSANSLSELSPDASAGAAVFRVPTIAALKALSVARLTNGQAVEVLGYYAAGDGGGGLFRYSSGSALADNGGTIIATNVGAGRWLRVYDREVNVRWFGAKGDNATNDYAAFLAAFAIVDALSLGAPVYVPTGTYKIDFPNPVGGFTLANPRTVRGDGQGNSTLNFYNTAAQYIFPFTITASDISFRNLTLNNYGGGGTSAAYIMFALGGVANIDNFSVRFCKFNGRASGLAATSMHFIKIADTTPTTGCEVTDCEIVNHDYGIFATNTYTATGDGWIFSRNKFYKGNADDIQFNCPAGTFRNLVVSDNLFQLNQYVGLAAGFAVGLARCYNATINDNIFDTYTQDAIHVEDASGNVSISGNVFRLCQHAINILNGPSGATLFVNIINNIGQGAAGARVGIPSATPTFGIQLVDDGSWPRAVTVLGNMFSYYDYGFIGGRSTLYSQIQRNHFSGCCCGATIFPAPGFKDNLLNQCTYAIQTGAESGLVGAIRLKECTNLFYSSTKRVTFEEISVWVPVTNIGAGASADIPLFPTPTKMWAESTIEAMRNNANNLGAASSVLYNGVLTESNHWTQGAGDVGAGTQLIAGGNLCVQVFNGNAAAQDFSLQTTHKGGITFN